MGKVQFAIVRVQHPGYAGAPIASAAHLYASEVKDSSGTSQATTLTPALAGIPASQPGSAAWRVTVRGTTDVCVRFADSPTALADGTSGYYCPAPGVYEFACSSVTEKGAVIEAT